MYNTYLPFISISISTYNRLILLQRLIDSLREYNIYNTDAYELITVDDSTNNDTWDWLNSNEYIKGLNHKLIRLGGQGDAKCKNTGLKLASEKTEFYWHLDDDVYLTKPGLLQYGVKIMRAFPEIGILSFHTHRLPEAPHIMQKHHLPYATEERDGLLVWYKNFSSCSDWFMRKSMVDEIGLFDENVKQGVELRKKNLDTLYIERIKAAGNKWKVASIPDCGVIHADMREMGFGPTY